ncbi:hypothetical protein GW17_00058721 [Ensete ventricosum]|nr:hypothetical protein GW17_00058721 [Ensete ventricosum]
MVTKYQGSPYRGVPLGMGGTYQSNRRPIWAVYRYAIDAMQSVCLREAGKKPDDPLAEETTLIQQTFGGYLRSKIRCSRCKSKSERCERMMDLTVEIDGNISTLDEALLRFTSPEILDGKNKYECGRLVFPCSLIVEVEHARIRYGVILVSNLCSVRKALAHELEQARKTRRSKGKPGGSLVAQQKTCFYPQRMMGDHPNFHSSDLFNERLRLVRNDSSSDSSSLFDEGSSCSTESTRDSTSTEEYWERMSGESDSVNLNSPLRVVEESDGFTCSPLSGRHSSKAVLSGSMPDHHRDDDDDDDNDSECIANSSGREINQVEAERPGRVKHHSDERRSFLYPDKNEHCRNLTTEQCRAIETGWINPNEVKSGIVSRRPSRERSARTFY